MAKIEDSLAPELAQSYSTETPAEAAAAPVRAPFNVPGAAVGRRRYYGQGGACSHS